MRLRDFKMSDAADIDSIFIRQPELGIPSLKNTADTAVIENGDGKVIAYGVVKLYAEGVLILDHSIRKREKAESVILMVRRAIDVARKSGLENLYVISNDPNYTNCLKKRFGFKNSSGETLFLELEA